MAVSILYLSFYNHKTITEQTLKFRVIFLLKCLRLSWVWPAAPKSCCMLRKK